MHPHTVFLAELQHTQVDINGPTKSIPPTATIVEGNESCLHISLNHLHKLILIQLIIQFLLHIFVWHRPSVINILNSQTPLRSNMIALSKIPHQFEDVGVIALNLELLHLGELGHMRRSKHGFSGRIVDNTSAFILQQKTFGQSQCLCTPIHHGVFEFCEGRSHGVAEIGCLESGGEHLREDTSHVDGGGVVAEIVGSLPVHHPRHDGVLGPFQQVLNGVSLLGSRLRQDMAKEAWLRVRMDGFVRIGVAFLDEFDHLLGALLKRGEVVVGMRHKYIYNQQRRQQKLAHLSLMLSIIYPSSNATQ